MKVVQYSAEAQFAKSQCLKDTRQRQQYQHGLSMVHKHTDENTQTHENVNTRTLGQKCVNPNTLVKARLGLSVVHLR